MYSPSVTIVINVFNGSRFLRAALLSVLEVMESRKAELLIFDNCSTDSTWEVASKFLTEFAVDFEMSYVTSLKHTSLFMARNNALDLVNTEFVTFLDADDCFVNDKITRGVKLLNAKGCDALFGNVNYFFDDANGYKHVDSRDNNYQLLMKPVWGREYYFPWASNLFRTKKAKAVRFESEYEIIGDYILVNEFLKSGKVLFSNSIFGSQRLHAGSTSRNYLRFLVEHIRFHFALLQRRGISMYLFFKVIIYFAGSCTKALFKDLRR